MSTLLDWENEGRGKKDALRELDFTGLSEPFRLPGGQTPRSWRLRQTRGFLVTTFMFTYCLYI